MAKQIHLKETQVTGTGHCAWNTNSAIGEGFRNWDTQRKQGFVRDCKGMPVLINSHNRMRTRSKSYFRGWWEMKRMMQLMEQGKKWSIRRKFRLSVGETCLMSHWNYHGCKRSWWCYEYLRMDSRRVRGKVIFPSTQQSQKCALQGPLCEILRLWSKERSPGRITAVSSGLGFC